MKKDLILLGAGGHAKVLFEVLTERKELLSAISVPVSDKSKQYSEFQEYSTYTDEELLKISTNSVVLINGIGSLPYNNDRFLVFNKFFDQGFSFKTVLSPSSRISSSAHLDEGVQVMAGAIIQSGAFIGKNTIVNTGAVVDHDCKIGEHNHIAPGAVLSGKVQTKDNVHIGTNASVIQSISIGKFSVIGSGVSVTKDVPSEKILYPSKATIKKYTFDADG